MSQDIVQVTPLGVSVRIIDETDLDFEPLNLWGEIVLGDVTVFRADLSEHYWKLSMDRDQLVEDTLLAFADQLEQT